MKKLLSVLLCLMLTATFIAACDTDDSPFHNPGDNLGGGGTASSPSIVDVSETENSVISAGKQDLSSESADLDSSGATLLVGSEIKEQGSYILRGSYPDGIMISVGNSETTHLFLDGATVTSDTGVAISNTNKKSTLVITAISGTSNTVSTTAEDVNAIHVKGSLVFNGSGSLNVDSVHKSGVKVSKTLKIVDQTLIISASSYGISARTVIAENASVTVSSAGKDGIRAECDDDTTSFTLDEGYVSFKDVVYTAQVHGDGIQADTFVYIDGGTYNITTEGAFVEKNSSNMTMFELDADDFKYVSSGSDYKRVAKDYNGRETKYALTQSCKGIKVGEISYTDSDGTEIDVTDGDYYLYIAGGTFNITSTDDALHVNSGNLTIADGTFTFNTYDDAITSDYLTKIVGGTITVASSYEGIEGGYVEICGGNIDITSSDDGVNAASDDESVKEYIVVSGGNLTIDASGDGIDSNGTLLISGGTVIVHGPVTGGDSGMDSETGILIDGGTVFVTSTLGMVETPATNSAQYVVSYAQNYSAAAGATFSLYEGKTLLFSVTIKKTCQSMIVSLPDFNKDSSYTIKIDDTEVADFTIASILTSIGANTSSLPGDMGPGGGRPGGGIGGHTPPRSR